MNIFKKLPNTRAEVRAIMFHSVPWSKSWSGNMAWGHWFLIPHYNRTNQWQDRRLAWTWWI